MRVGAGPGSSSSNSRLWASSIISLWSARSQALVLAVQRYKNQRRRRQRRGAAMTACAKRAAIAAIVLGVGRGRLRIIGGSPHADAMIAAFGPFPDDLPDQAV